MSLKKSAQPLRLKILPSRQLAIFILLTHVAATLIVSQLELPWYVVSTLSVCIVLSLYTNLRRYVGMKSPHSIVEAVWNSDGEWSLLTARGHCLDGELLPSSCMYAALVLLNFRIRPGRSVRTLILPNDSLDRLTFRHLRVRLAIQPPK